MNKERITCLDVAKGIGIILVVVGHVIGEGSKAFRGSDVLREYIYTFHMALFFVVSGMLLKVSFSNQEISLEVVKKKCLSITTGLLFPYFLWSVIYFILDNEQLSINGCKEWIYTVITFRGIAPIWFLGALFWAEMMAIILIWILKQKTSKIIVSTAACIIIIFFVSCHFDLSQIQSMHLQYFAVFVLRGVLCLTFILVGYLMLPVLLLEKESYIFLICTQNPGHIFMN